jgi:prepilin-type N-terminal cleavage/methylation domain-containing protein
MNIKASTWQNGGGAVRAFTLVEVLVSVGLLAIMLAAIYPAFILGYASIKTTREDQRATQIVTQKLESVRLCTWNELATYPATFVDYYNPLGLTNGTQGTLYAGTMSVTNANSVITGSPTPSYQSNVRLVTMGVTWTNYVNNSPIVHTRQMQTLSALNGLQNYIFGSQ